MIKRLFLWYADLRSIEDYIAPGHSQRLRNNIRGCMIILAAAPGIAMVEWSLIDKPWREFDHIEMELPEPPPLTIKAGQPWPDDAPTDLLTDILPQSIAEQLPADAAVPQGQSRLTVFSIVERVESHNRPVSQNWLSSLTRPGGDPVTTKVNLWCGFDLQKMPVERLCVATIPVPVFGRVLSGPCLSGDAFAIHQTLLRSEVCEQDSRSEGVCNRLVDWNARPPRVGETIQISDKMQCSASMILPYLMLEMRGRRIRVTSQTISPIKHRFEPDIEHGYGFTRALTVLSHDAAIGGQMSWDELWDTSGNIPVSITSQTRAAGLFWTQYDSRHDVNRGHNAKKPTRVGSVFLGKISISLASPQSFRTAAHFLEQDLPTSSDITESIPEPDTLNIPKTCKIGNIAQTPSRSSLDSLADYGYLIRVSDTACPEVALRSALMKAVFAK